MRPVANRKDRPSGRGCRLAVGALLGVGLLVTLVMIVTRLREEARREREAVVVAQLRAIAEGQHRFYQEDLERDDIYDFASLDELVALELVSDSLARAAGYSLRVRPDGPRWEAWAEPLEGSARHFYTDHTGTIRSEPDRPASPTSPVLP